MGTLEIVQRQSQLFEIVQTLRAPGRFANTLDSGKEQTDQDPNNGYHHQQLYQGKAGTVQPILGKSIHVPIMSCDASAGNHAAEEFGGQPLSFPIE